MLSSRARLAMRVLLDLSVHYEEGLIPIEDVAPRQGILFGLKTVSLVEAAMDRKTPLVFRKSFDFGRQDETPRDLLRAKYKRRTERNSHDTVEITGSSSVLPTIEQV